MSLVNLPEKISFGAPGPYLDDSTCNILVVIQLSIFFLESQVQMLNILTRLASFQRHVCGVYQTPVYLFY